MGKRETRAASHQPGAGLSQTREMEKPLRQDEHFKSFNMEM
jgi:hypothetical protein